MPARRSGFCCRAAADKPDPAGVRRGTETVLLAEDEAGVRRLATVALEMHGYTVLAAGSANEAAALARSHGGPIDLLITDVVMPDIGGRELAEGLRRDRPGVRVLFMSGYTDDDLVRHGIATSEEWFLHKPFTPLALARRVGEAIEAGRP